MTKEQKLKCHTIIHSTAVAAASVGAGLAQLPCSDNAAIVPIQVMMIVSLNSVFGLKIEQSRAKSLLGTAMATTLGRGISQVLVGWVPAFGNVCNAVTAAAVTELIAWAIISDMANRSPCQEKGRKNNAYHKKSV